MLSGLAVAAISETASASQSDEWAVYAIALQVEAPLGTESSRAEIVNAQAVVLERLEPGTFEVVYAYTWVPGLALRLSSSAADALRRMPEVRAIDLDVGGEGSLAQSGPHIGADVVHRQGVTGREVKVGVIDTGADTDHPDLIDDLVAGACRCNTGVDCCPTGGSVGDTLASAEDDNGHGTHVTGIVTGRGVRAPVGIAPDAKVVVVRALNDNRFDSTADIVASLDWLKSQHPDAVAVNMSLGTFNRLRADCDLAAPDYSPPSFVINFGSAVEVLRQVGVVSVVAAGNDSDETDLPVPGCLSNVITVGATEGSTDVVASFSNSNATLDVWAPGVDVRSAYLEGGTRRLSGTSMAAPHVTAALALVAEGARSIAPSEAAECVTTSPMMITDSRNGITRPRLDLEAALLACGQPAGTACTSDVMCASDNCVDGVCCTDACGGDAPDDCQACSVVAGGSLDGTCTPLALGSVCRPARGRCDAVESCDGGSVDCPQDTLHNSAFVCRAAVGDCDADEVCSGDSIDCPQDAKRTDECRPAGGDCDLPEVCDGISDQCPVDILRPATEICRTSTGPCDVEERCDGESSGCPVDSVRSSTVACRLALGACDVSEFCDGLSGPCPIDVVRSSTVTCRVAGGNCDLAERCDGVGVDCPLDQVRTSTVVCRGADGACDVEERCDGVGPGCPLDRFALDGTSCADGLTCNGEETCAVGVCVAGAPLSCDDGDICTAEACVEPLGCRSTPVAECCRVDAECDDGDACTEDRCVENSCQATPVAACEGGQCGCWAMVEPRPRAVPVAGLLLLIALLGVRVRRNHATAFEAIASRSRGWPDQLHKGADNVSDRL